MTVQQEDVVQERVYTLDEIVAEIQRLQNNGGAEGLYGHINVNVATCLWQKPPKGSKKRILIMAFGGRGDTKQYWCVNEGIIGHEVRNGHAFLTTDNQPDLMLRLPALARA